MRRYFKSRKCLYRQLKLLAEASRKQIPNDGLAQYSDQMVAINKELKSPFCAIFFGFLIFNFGIHFFIFVKKLFWSKR